MFSDGTVLPTRCVVWGGGIKAAAVAADCGLAQGRGGRVDVQPDLTFAGSPGVYFVGDIANIADTDGELLPQLGSVALQSGAWAADNIIAEFDGKERKEFRLQGQGDHGDDRARRGNCGSGQTPSRDPRQLAHMAWLGVHASLMTGTRDKIEALVDWAWDRVQKTGGPHVLDRGDEAEINWNDDPTVMSSSTLASTQTSG